MSYLSKEEKEYMIEKIIEARHRKNIKSDFESMIKLADNVITAIYYQEVEKKEKKEPSNQMTLEEWENDPELKEMYEEQYWDKVWQDYQNGEFIVTNFDNGKLIQDQYKDDIIEKMNEEMQRRSR